MPKCTYYDDHEAAARGRSHELESRGSNVTWPEANLEVETGRTSRVEINLLRQYARLSDLGKYNRRPCVHTCNTKVIVCAEELQQERATFDICLIYFTEIVPYNFNFAHFCHDIFIYARL